MLVALAYLSEFTELPTKFAVDTTSAHLVAAHRPSIASIGKLVIPHLTWYVPPETGATGSWVLLLLDHVRLGNNVHDSLIVFTR